MNSTSINRIGELELKFRDQHTRIEAIENRMSEHNVRIAQRDAIKQVTSDDVRKLDSLRVETQRLRDEAHSLRVENANLKRRLTTIHHLTQPDKKGQ